MLGLLAGAPFIHAQRTKPRNILFISTDDLNNDLGCYGHPMVRTPHIDSLAANGVRFDRAYCQFPLCSPSRTSIMTGLAPDTTRVYDLRIHFRETIPNVITMPQHFQKNGYFAARVGKIYHYGNPGQIGTDGLDDKASWNQVINPKGIDKQEEAVLTNYTPQRGLGSSLSFYASPAKDEEHTDGMVAEEVVELMSKHRNEPFFLGAGFYRPHCPYIAPSKYFDMFPLESIEAVPFHPTELEIAPKWAYFTTPPNWGLSDRQVREVRRAYFASVAFVDANVGRLLTALKKFGLAENTTIVFWSDHGYNLGEHGQWKKQSLWEPSARLPLIVSGAGVESRGKGCQRTVELLDVYPTLSTLAGLIPPQHLHGKSLDPLLRDPGAAWDRPAITQVRRGDASNPVFGYSIRNERYRYTMWADGQEGEEMYDYATDPMEMRNLVREQGAHRAVQQQMAAQLRTIIASRKSAPNLG
jgi:iduronate 2-sulfatase